MKNNHINKSIMLPSVILFSYALFTFSSASMPFVPSADYLKVLWLIMFPLLNIIYFWLIFFHKKPKTGLTRWEHGIKLYLGKLRKLYAFLAICIGGPMLIAAQIFLSQWYPALIAKHYSTNTRIINAVIINITKPRTTFNIIHLQENGSHKIFDLHWPKTHALPICPGDTLQLKINNSWLGDYVRLISILPSHNLSNSCNSKP